MTDKHYNDLETKVALLKDGQVVEIDGLLFKAERFIAGPNESPCNYCNMGSLCHDDISEVCNMLDLFSKSVWILHLVS